MGVQGLRKLIESSGCTRQLPLPSPAAVASSQHQTQQQKSTATQFHRYDDHHDDDDDDDDHHHHHHGQQGGGAAAAAPGGGEEAAEITADHVCIDMNGVIHGAFSRSHADPQTTIDHVLSSLEYLLSKVVHARRSLILAFDGPAPVAKLATQRLRRRKVSHLDVTNNANFSDLSITTGSVFMLELEQHVTRFLASRSSNKRDRSCFLARTANISISGTSVPGEGEAKIAQALGQIAAMVARNENDSVVVIGNDIDLVLTCIGATAFHNIGVLNPQTMQVIDVGSFMARWVSAAATSSAGESQMIEMIDRRQQEQQQKINEKNGKNNNNDDDDDGFMSFSSSSAAAMSAGFVPFSLLPGTRIDFVWLFMLNGSDYYDGLGDVALSLWKRYRMLKKERSEFRLVSKTHCLITRSLRLLFQCEQVEVSNNNNDDDDDNNNGDGGEQRQKNWKQGASAKRRQRSNNSKNDDDIDADERDNEAFDGDGKRRGSNSAANVISPAQRHAALGLLNASLWSLITTVSGQCPNFRFRPFDTKQDQDSTFVTSQTMRATIGAFDLQAVAFRVPKHSLHDAAEMARLSKARGHQVIPSPESSLAPLTPLQTFTALMPRASLLPKPVQAVLDKKFHLQEQWQSGNAIELSSAVRKLFQALDVQELSPAERFLTQFGETIDVKGAFYRGHPLEGVARRDASGNRKLVVDFFRFAYGTKQHQDVSFPLVAPDLVPGATKMNVQSAETRSKLKRATRLQARMEEKKKAKMERALERRAKKKLSASKLARFIAKKQQKKQEQQSTANTNRQLNNKNDGVRRLYWYDVFSRESRGAVAVKKNFSNTPS